MTARWLAVGLLASCGSLPSDGDVGSEARRRPNVVLIVADDLGWADVRANNPGCFYDTPHLDRLAASGARFTDGYAANPVCSPTRYSIQTGRYPSRVDATNWFSGKRAGRQFRAAAFENRMELDEVTLAEALRDAGYATFFAGKWHLGPTEDYWPERQGYDVNRGGWKLGGPYGGKKYFSPYGNPRLEDGPDGEHLPDRLARETVAFAEQHRDRPFFATLCFYSVHTPLMAPDDLVAKYRERRAQLPDVFTEFVTEEQVLPIETERRVRVVQRHAVYAAMVESMDRAVGRVLDGLESLGLADDTIVIFTSDNGGVATAQGHATSNLPLRCGKGWVYEGGIREPFFVRAPGVTRAGHVSDAPVMSIDIYPTVLDLCGVEPRVPVDGVSFADVLRGEGLPDRNLFWHYPHYSGQGGFPGGAVRCGDLKLVERYEDGRVHLYDLSRDVGEQVDLAAERPEIVAAMRADLHAWYRDVDAKFLRPKDHTSPAPWRPDRSAPSDR